MSVQYFWNLDGIERFKICKVNNLMTIGGFYMLKKFLSVLLIISLMLSLAACSILNIRKNARVIPFGRDVPEFYAEEDNESEEQNDSTDDMSGLSALFGEGSNIISGLGGILGALKGTDSVSSMVGGLLPKTGWPSEHVPKELPEYTGGEIANSGGFVDDFYIFVDETDDDALNNYINKLKKNGWIVTRDYDDEKEAVLGPHTLYIRWNSEDSLQMNLMTVKQGSWPYDKLPPDLIPPETGTLVGEISIQEYDDITYFVYTYDGIDSDAAAEYMKMLIDNGWEGDSTYISKTFEWNGKKYSASVEIYETIETRSSFTFNMQLIN